jgi:hypothetical protein
VNVTAAKMRPDDYDDEYGELSIRKKPAKTSTALFVLLICGVLAVGLFSCMAGAVMVVMEEHDRPIPPQAVLLQEMDLGPEAAKLIGSWKGRLALRGMDRNHVYIFRKNGTLREEVFDLRGVRGNASEARWQFVNGQIIIDWPGGGREIATARWIDANTMEYRILDHTDVAQNGVAMTFRRQ